LKPVLLVIAGPNGSGKTTVTVALRRDRWSKNVEYINPDEIAQERFGGWNSPQAILDAATWATSRREELLTRGEGIAFETVFSAPDKLDFLLRAKQAGYFIRMFFVSTNDPTINAARVTKRVMQGGHTVPIEKIISRYSKSIANFDAALTFVDRAYLYDNSVDGHEAKLCARVHEGALRKVYENTPAWVMDVIAALPKHVDFEDSSSEFNP
jgi:predicted ABC-type ATPase